MMDRDPDEGQQPSDEWLAGYDAGRREAAAAPALDPLMEARRRIAEPKNPWTSTPKALGWEVARNAALRVIDGLLAEYQRLTPPEIEREAAADERLREVAKAATPGPWQVEFPESGEMHVRWRPDPAEPYGNVVASWPSEVWGEQGREGSDIRNAKYIAAASPDRVLALLARRTPPGDRDRREARLVEEK